MHLNIWSFYGQIRRIAKIGCQPKKTYKKAIKNRWANHFKVKRVKLVKNEAKIKIKINLILVKSEAISKTKIILWSQKKVISTETIRTVKKIGIKNNERKRALNRETKRGKKEKIVSRVEINVRKKKTTLGNNKIISFLA